MDIIMVYGLRRRDKKEEVEKKHFVKKIKIIHTSQESFY